MKKIYSRVLEHGILDRIQLEEIDGKLYVTGFNKGESSEITECEPILVTGTTAWLLKPDSLYAYKLESE